MSMPAEQKEAGTIYGPGLFRSLRGAATIGTGVGERRVKPMRSTGQLSGRGGMDRSNLTMNLSASCLNALELPSTERDKSV